jgi:hypothetical protein
MLFAAVIWWVRRNHSPPPRRLVTTPPLWRLLIDELVEVARRLVRRPVRVP